VRVCIISATYVTQEPRVLRQIRTFQERGWDVSVIGYPGHLPIPSSWDFHDMTVPTGWLPEPAAGSPTLAAASELMPEQAEENSTEATAASTEATVAKLSDSRSLLAKLPAFLYWRAVYPCIRLLHSAWRKLAKLAVFLYWRAVYPCVRRLHSVWRKLTKPLRNDTTSASTRSLMQVLYEADQPREISGDEAHEIFFAAEKNRYFRDVLAGSISPADLVIAHDYMTIPLANLLVDRGTPFVIDIHEYAREQYHFEAGSHGERYFERVTRPMVETLHAEYFPKARALSAVCNGISRQLQIDHALPQAPAVVRSTPFYSEQPFRPTGDTIDVMYHGLIDSSRHLEVGIRSLPLWRPEFRFTIRGPGPQDYIDQLLSLARQLGVEDRVSIEPPVPFDEIVTTANRADIGYLAFMNYSRQRQFASPNKFFEYIMAGLALVVMDVPELAPTVRQAGVGRLIDDFTPEAIAAAINSFDRASIDASKRASLELARELCWEREQERMITAYGLAEFEAAA
jgi:glycosyltransferase involved in cell wall biosynthesis